MAKFPVIPGIGQVTQVPGHCCLPRPNLPTFPMLAMFPNIPDIGQVPRYSQNWQSSPAIPTSAKHLGTWSPNIPDFGLILSFWMLANFPDISNVSCQFSQHSPSSLTLAMYPSIPATLAMFPYIGQVPWHSHFWPNSQSWPSSPIFPT